MEKNFFERHPKLTLAAIVLFGSSLLVVGLNAMAGFFGLGKTIVYEAHPIYGYRPEPNQNVARTSQVKIKINNLGLRAEEDWDAHNFHHKVLFLGDSVTYGGSYVDNQQLFSYLAVKSFPPYQGGNAGVNAWGVHNVHALVQEAHFMPAQIFVSVFPEGDFYRGLQRIGGQPFWTRKPSFALEELGHYFIYQIHLKKTPLHHFATLPESEKIKIAETAVMRLKELDDYLKANHRDHLIYISPSRSQLLHEAAVDQYLPPLFAKYQLRVTYLKDQLEQLPPEEVKSIFHDEIHLTPRGHEVWAQLISPDLKDIILLREKESLLAYAAKGD